MFDMVYTFFAMHPGVLGGLLYVVSSAALFLSTFAIYIAMMSVKNVRQQMLDNGTDFHPVVLAMFYILLGFGLISDLVLNLGVMTVLLLEPPYRALAGEILVTHRIQHYVRGPHKSGWRYKICYWICVNCLEPFQKGHCLPH